MAEKIRARYFGLPTLLTTGYTRDAIGQQDRLAPDVQLLTKPYTLDGLARKVRQVLDSVTATGSAYPVL